MNVYTTEPEASRLGEHTSTPKSRGYTMRARQMGVDQTRLRITEAAMRLHEQIGPAATTVSAVADEAGVTRLTVYRHFPDEEALIVACSGHWGELHPRPDPAGWAAIGDPVQRTRVALSETYAWAATAAPMMTQIYRDLDDMPAFVRDHLDEEEKRLVGILAKGFGAHGRRRRRLTAALAHALHVRTWESLCSHGELRNEEAADLMVATVLRAVGRS